VNKELQSNNTTGMKGIYWHNRDHKWHVQIKVRGKLLFSRYFSSLDEAIQKRKELVQTYYNQDFL